MFTCPAATIVIVKSIVVAPNTVTDEISMYVQRQGVGQFLFDRYDFTDTLHDFRYWEGWIVLEPSDGIYLATLATGFSTWGSGALLPQPSA